jgi:hypothetical protein
MLNGSKGAVIFGLFMLVLASSFAGSPGEPPIIPIEELIEPTCIDGINNDGDNQPGTGIASIDFTDWECLYMPFDVVTNTNSVGEYDQSNTYTPAYVNNYVSFIEQTQPGYPTFFDLIQWKIDNGYGPYNFCSQEHQNVLVEYRNFGMSPEKSGINEYQAYCGVSF